MDQPLSNLVVIKEKKPKPAEQAAATPPQPDIKVYKCPYKTCNFQAFNYDDLTIHRINDHSDVPRFFTNDLSVGKGGFSREKLRRQNNQVFLFKLGVIKMRVKIFMKDWDTRQKKNRESSLAKRKAWMEKRAKARESKKKTEVKPGVVKV